MADDVKGLSIKLGADTSGVKKAFKDLTKDGKQVEGQLKQINKALKFDPTNTALLEQKQRLLGTAVKNTAGYLEEARKAQDEFVAGGGDVNSAAYTQMVIETESLASNLSRLESQSEETEHALTGTGKSAEEASGGISKVETATKKAQVAMGALSHAAGDLLSSGLKKIGSLIAGSIKETLNLADDVNTLANNYGISAEAAYTLYQYQDLLDYSTSSITKAIKEQNADLAESSDAYQKLGIAVADSEGNMLSQELVFVKTLEYLRGIEDPVQRAAQGVELLGNKYYDLGGILSATDEQFSEFKNGLTKSDEELAKDIENIGAFKDSMDELWKTLKSAAVDIAGDVLGKFQPVMDDIVKTIQEADLPGLFWETWDQISSTFSNAAEIGSKIVDDLLSGIQGAWDSLTGWITSAWSSVKSIFTVSVGTSGGGGAIPQHEDGLAYVPYDNYLAYLHQGERVLTAEENRAYSQGEGGGSGVTINQYISQPMESPIQLAAATEAMFQRARWT